MSKTLKNQLLVIDWESTDYHARFNQAFFAATGLEQYEFASFSPNLSGAQAPHSITWAESRRFNRFVRVLTFCIRNRNAKILFLTYDALYLPIITLFCSKVIVYEHNTTPEPKRISKHVLWQALTYKRVFRLAQYKQQYTRLLALKQDCAYIGSPLKTERIEHGALAGNCILIGSRKFTLAEASMLSESFPDASFLLRELTQIETPLSDSWIQYNIKKVEWFDEQELFGRISAIYVDLDSDIRGSGWFNDAIALNITLVLRSPKVKALFSENFVNHCFVDLELRSEPKFECDVLPSREDDYIANIEDHNKALRCRFKAALAERSWL